MKKIIKFKIVLLAIILLVPFGCEDLETENLNNPDRQLVLASGTDLLSVMAGGYITFWQGIHDVHPNSALAITSDMFGVSWGNFGGRRMGNEPRDAYNNASSESQDYKKLVEDPWFGAIGAVSTANDIILALDQGTTIDNGGDRDKAVLAAAYFLRGISNGYLGLMFDVAYRVIETDDVSQLLEFTPYQGMIAASVDDLQTGIGIANSAGADFEHAFFNGVSLGKTEFVQLSNSYAARFLSSWPRTPAEASQIAWGDVLTRANAGVTFDFSPIADGNFWFGTQQFFYEETGNGDFWHRIDQRIVAAADPSQPTRYPETIALGEAPLTDSVITSADARVLTDWKFTGFIDFPTDRGEWHFSHYKINRNITDPTWAGDATAFGPMPTFMKADNDMLKAEAMLNTGNAAGAIAVINAGTRVTRGGLAPLAANASVAEINLAIMYEKSIELLGTAPFSLWMERRRRPDTRNASNIRLTFNDVDALGGLQLGTPAQLPVPAKELDIREEETYNFGGINTDPTGISRF